MITISLRHIIRGLLILLLVLLMGGGSACGRKTVSAPPVQIPPEPALKPRPYQVFGQWYQPLPHARGYRETGVASWYGKDFHGKPTSSGEIYDMHAKTAAHKTLPLGTVVRVRNPANQRQIELRINDRGPFVAGRVIDLSYAAARHLDIIGPGTAPVEIEAIGTTVATGSVNDPNVYYQGTFTIQVGAFTVAENARRLRQELARKYSNAHVVEFRDRKSTYYRVRVTRASNLEQALVYEQRLRQEGFAGAFVVGE